MMMMIMMEWSRIVERSQLLLAVYCDGQRASLEGTERGELSLTWGVRRDGPA
jgi:hypothetical protein